MCTVIIHLFPTGIFVPFVQSGQTYKPFAPPNFHIVRPQEATFLRNFLMFSFVLYTFYIMFNSGDHLNRNQIISMLFGGSGENVFVRQFFVRSCSSSWTVLYSVVLISQFNIWTEYGMQCWCEGSDLAIGMVLLLQIPLLFTICDACSVRAQSRRLVGQS